MTRMMTTRTCTLIGAEMPATVKSPQQHRAWRMQAWRMHARAHAMGALDLRLFTIDDFLRDNGATPFTQVPSFSHWRLMAATFIGGSSCYGLGILCEIYYAMDVYVSCHEGSCLTSSTFWTLLSILISSQVCSLCGRTQRLDFL